MTNTSLTDTILQCNSLSMLKNLPSDSVHYYVTSPSHYTLRDYGASDRIGATAQKLPGNATIKRCAHLPTPSGKTAHVPFVATSKAREKESA